MMEYFDTYFSPIGLIVIYSDGSLITRISFSENEMKSAQSCRILKDAFIQMDEYFDGTRIDFDIPINPQGTDFQKKVWSELIGIPYGQMVSYKDIALKTGDVNNVRAVGTANGKNPIAIVIPCHRVISTNGKLTGYAGGIWRKKWLLNHESKFKPIKNTLF